MKNKLNLILILLGAAIFSSCGSARTIIYDPVCIPTHIMTNQVEICRGVDTVPVANGVKDVFEKQLTRKLFGDGQIQRGPGIKLKYRFIQYNEGSRFARYMLGGIGNCGEASLLVEVVYLDCNGMELGKIQAEGKISSGIAGGSSDSAVQQAAEEVATYTRGIILNACM
jgi:hypothetical protein